MLLHLGFVPFGIAKGRLCDGRKVVYHLVIIVDPRIEVDDRTEAYLRALQQKVTSDTQIVSSHSEQAMLGPGGGGVSRDRGLGF